MKRIILGACALVGAAAGLAQASADVLLPPAAGSVRLAGRTGLSVDRCIDSRAYSDWARVAMYGECVNSFRTHWDDADGHVGWQNEYWGKTMLCFAGAAADAGVPQVWELTLYRGIESKTIPVSDFASVSNLDDAENWFSLWF